MLFELENNECILLFYFGGAWRYGREEGRRGLISSLEYMNMDSDREENVESVWRELQIR